MNKDAEFLIVGQGLAGTLLAFQLLKIGKTVHIIDNHHQGAASAVAAGIINPITGRRFVKSWMIDELLPVAKEAYQYLEKILNVRLFYDRKLIRILSNAGEQNNWLCRSDAEGYKQYMEDDSDFAGISKHFHSFFSNGCITQAAQVDLPLLIKKARDYFIDQKILTVSQFDFNQIFFINNHVNYESKKYRKIIFSEGQQVKNNPFFQKLPFVPAKGELFKITIPNLETERLIKHKIMLAPLPDNTYWAGATTDWHFEDDKPTSEGKQKLMNWLNKSLLTPFQIKEHLSAIRPTVKDRRPTLGMHPDYPELAIFNGLGTKGTSLAPYWATKMVDFLVNGLVLPKEVDIGRF